MYTHVDEQESCARLIEDAVLEQGEALPGIHHHILHVIVPKLERQNLRETIPARHR